MKLQHCSLILTVTLLFLLLSCKEEVKKTVEPAAIGSIYVRYLNPEGYYTVQVEFGEQLSDSVLQKPDWKSVPAFNNILLQEKPRSEFTRFYAGEFLATYQKNMTVDLIHCPKGLQKVNLSLTQPNLVITNNNLISSNDFTFSLQDEQLLQSEETLVIPTFSAASQVAPVPAEGGWVVSVPRDSVGSVAAYFRIRYQLTQT